MRAQLGDYIRYCSDPDGYHRNGFLGVKDLLEQVVEVRKTDDGVEEYITTSSAVVSETELDYEDVLLPSEAHEGHL